MTRRGRPPLAWIRASLALVRWVLFAVSLPLATAGAMPAWARLVSEPAHVCHCRADEHACLCVRCNPENRELALSRESVQGRCGDDEATVAGKTLVGVVPAGLTLVAPAPETFFAASAPRPRGGEPRPPPTPPPRA